jgi:hypothetical protein
VVNEISTNKPDGTGQEHRATLGMRTMPDLSYSTTADLNLENKKEFLDENI